MRTGKTQPKLEREKYGQNQKYKKLWPNFKRQKKTPDQNQDRKNYGQNQKDRKKLWQNLEGQETQWSILERQ